ncbi:hypothetical protein QYM36_003205, partial [Artemia franciscana]
ESYLPRSASMNFTLDLFGQSMNLFEIGGRFEGLEYLIESYFGPEGIYRATEVWPTVQEIFSNFKEKFWSRFNSPLQPERAAWANEDFERLNETLVKIKMNLDDTFYNPPKGDFFLRLFGAEIATYSYRHGLDVPGADIIFDQIFRVLDNMINGAKNQQVEIAQSVMFLDGIARFPTIAGLPLRLAWNGAASLALDFESQIDVKAIIRDPKTASLGLTIIPMASTEISVSMGVEVNNLRYGVKTILNLHSSPGGGMKTSWHQGKSFEFKLDIPKTKMSLVDAKSFLYIFSQNIDDGSEKVQKMNVLNSVEYKRGGCVERVSSLLGLRYCRQYAMLVPPTPTAVGAIKDITPVFPLSGHFEGSIYIEKTEPSMTGIYVIAKGSNNGGKTSFEIIFDTPDSHTNRTIVFTGIGLNTQSRYGVEGKAQLDSISYEAKAYIDMAQSSSILSDSPGIDYTPTIEYTPASGKKEVLVTGKVTIIEGKRIFFLIRSSGLWKNLLLAFGDVKFNISNAVQKIEYFTVLETPLGLIALTTLYSRDHHSCELKTKFGSNSTRWDFGLIWGFKKTPENLENNLNFVFEPASISSFRRFDISRPDFFESVIFLPEAKKNQISLKQYRKRRGSFATKDLIIENKIDVEYPGRRIKIYDNVQQVSEHIYKSVSSLELKPGPKYDLISLFTYDHRRDHLKFEIDAYVQPNYASKTY